MTKWKYRVEECYSDNVVHILTSLGSLGWELVSVIPAPMGPAANVQIYLKQPSAT